MIREKPRKQAKDIQNSSHGPDNVLGQVPPESRPNWKQCPNMGSVGFVLSFQKSPVLTFPPLAHPTQVSKDDRSDVESSSEEEDVAANTKSSCGSGSSNGASWVNGHMGGSCWAEE